ncbi:MAG TPA: CshA/CshB family fibrillar adhesin-related protein, partial [Niastella sp.]
MKKTFSLVIFVLYVHHFSFAQYATAGAGSLRNEIWWFDWAGLNMANGASKTFTTTDGLTVTVTFSNVTSPVPVPNVMNNWVGAVLHFLYNFTDPAIKPALRHTTTGIYSCSFTMQVTATRAGMPAPCTFIGADAEASITTEVTTLTTNGSNWQTVDFFRNSLQVTNPVTGCNTPTVSISDTYGGGTTPYGQNPIMATTTTTGSLSVDVIMDHRSTGGMAVAFGVMAPIDRGDLPATYGTVQHELTYSINNGCNYLPPLPSAIQSQTLKLGTVAGDADGYESLDDNTA